VGWRSTDPKYSPIVTIYDWYIGELIYDIDILYLLLDDKVIGVHGFDTAGYKGIPLSEYHKIIYIGYGSKEDYHFHGWLAVVVLNDEIPYQMEIMMDFNRSTSI
jgi:hypothetical protein